MIGNNRGLFQPDEKIYFEESIVEDVEMKDVEDEDEDEDEDEEAVADELEGAHLHCPFLACVHTLT